MSWPRPFGRRPRISSPDAGSLRRASWRTRGVRWALAALACVLLGLAYLDARGLEESQSEVVPGGSSGVLVIDLSLSISDGDLVNAGKAVRELIDTGPEMGLVVFSDVPYELLPPRTPARELRSLLRFLEPSPAARRLSPWGETFQSGTKISAAVELARDMLRRDGVNGGSILLVSDLQTAPDDLPALGKVLGGLRRSQTTTKVLPLSPTTESLQLFSTLLGPEALVDPLELRSTGGQRVDTVLRGDLPLLLLVLAALVLVVLALHERFGARLALPRGAEVRT